ncbi:M48 family metalloprotease [Epibacterium ulvae]|uniref:M48 family metalloprotease n=1 Tax=Epibacterium ulvae TaxID=1156985 RepID=UPI001BFCC76E|nr:M48 family metalloprotease [Epibacterium ulvae]MBT8154935.1 M48 family metalloprotease [Epibacterium ulvae]
MRRLLMLMAVLSIAACDVVIEQPQVTTAQQARSSKGVDRAAFASVQSVVEPVAERECRNRTSGLNCDFHVSIDPDRNAPPNAFQTLDKNGRPRIVFTQAMLRQLANRDELAFVMSHEAAHHIRNHLARQRQNAISGAIILGGLATLAGGTSLDVANAQDLGATVGARGYSKEFELEADELGTIITHRAGYRPSEGVRFFYRLPDPGDRFLGSHPSNPDRVKVVQATIRKYGLN